MIKIGFSDAAKTLILRRLFSVEDGRLRLFQKLDFTVYPARAMAKTLYHIGEKNDSDFLFELGYIAGEDAADEMSKALNLDLKGGHMTVKAVQQMMEIIGFGKFKIIKYKAGSPECILHITNHPVIEEAREIYGDTHFICDFYRGVYSAHGIKEFNIPNCHFKESQCYTKGNEFCEWFTGVDFKEVHKK